MLCKLPLMHNTPCPSDVQVRLLTNLHDACLQVIVLMASTMRRTSLALLLAACLATPGLAALPNLAWTPKYPNTTEQFTLRLVEGSVPGTLDCADTVARLSVSTDGYTLLDGFSTLKCPLTSSLTQGSGSPWACGWQPVGPCGPVPAGSYGWRVDYLSKSTGASLGYTAVSPAPRANVFMPSPQVGGPTEVRVLLTPSQSTPLRRRKDRLTIGVAVTGIKNCDPTWPVPVSIFVTDTTKLSCTLPSNANLAPTCSKLDKPITCTGLAATTTPVVLYVNAMARPDQRTYQDIPSSYLVISVVS